MKRLLALLLCLVMALSLIPAAAAEDIEIVEVEEEPIEIVEPEELASVPNESGTNYTMSWEYSDGTLTITGGGNDVIIWSDFLDFNAKTRKLIIGDGIKGIGQRCFSGGYNDWNLLEEVTLSESVKTIQKDAFYCCDSLQKVTVNGSTELQDRCFGINNNLTTFIFNNGYNRIADDAFYHVTATVYTPSGDDSWKWNKKDYGGNLSWSPEITYQPDDVSMAKYGDTVTLNVSAEGGNLSYQWQYGRSRWQDISGATQASYSFTISANADGSYNGGGKYRCVVTNSAGSATSNQVSVTVDETPAVTAHPKSVSAKAGDTVSFSVSAVGPDRSFQWYYRKNSSDSWKKSTASGATTATLSITAESYRNGYQYKCKVYNDAGYKYSKAATLTVLTKPSITTQPKSQSAKEGETVKFTVAATGGSLKYQWYYRTSSSGEWKESTGTGAKTKTLSVEAKAYRDGYQYRCKVSNDAGYKYSSAATLTVLTKPAITTQPSSKSVSAGTTVKFTVAASGGGLSYQWYYRTSSSGEWKKCTGTGATTATLTIEAKSYRNGYQYRCKVSNAVGYKYSGAATLTVK